MAKRKDTGIVVRSGETARILERKSPAGLPGTYRFLAEPLDPQETVSGTVEIMGAYNNIETTPHRQPLHRENAVERRDMQNVFRIDVTPDCDVRLTMLGGGSGARVDFVNTAIGVMIFAGVIALLISLF